MNYMSKVVGAFVLQVSGLCVMSLIGLTAEAAKSKRNAPDQEAYYSTVAVGVSEADLLKADKLRQKTIESIRSLLGSKKIAPSREFELRLRLGELHAERHDHMRDLEMNRYDKAYEAWLRKGKKGKEPKLSTKKSRSELAQAANAFRTLVNRFPKHQRTAAALYSLGKTLGRLNNPSAAKYFQQLIKKHPKSNLIPDTHLALGEYYFEKKKIDDAIRSYRQMLKFKEHSSYPYAMYKLGWAYYNAAPTKRMSASKLRSKSVAAFKLVVRLADSKSRKYARLNLREEALNDLVMAWAETEDTKSAWAYFRSIGEKNSFYDLLERLGNTYQAQGKQKEAIAIYRRLLKEAPVRPGNPEIYAKVVEMYEQDNNLQMVQRSLKDMNRLYVKGSPWTVINGRKVEVASAAKKIVEFQLHRRGTVYHQVGQKAKNKRYLATAAAIYEMYLDTFAKHSNAYEIRFYFADILQGMKKYEEAAKHFAIVANEKPKNGKYLKEAALASVDSLYLADKGRKYGALPDAGKVSEPLPLPQLKVKLLTQIDNYVRLLPKEKSGHPMRFTAAQTYFDYGHYDEAMKRYASIVHDIPESKQAQISVKIVLGYFSEREDWSQVVAWSQKFQGSPAIVKAGHGKVISTMLQAAMFNRALASEKKGLYLEAADSFMAFQKKFPKNSNADAALYNASLNYFKIGEVEKALAANNKILKGYPKSRTTRDVLVSTAETYESLTKFEDASRYYERFAVYFPKDERAPSALYNAAILMRGLQKYNQSVKLFERFAKKYPSDERNADVLLQIANMREDQKRYTDAVAFFGRYEKKVKDRDQKLFAQAKVAEITSAHISKSKGRSKFQALQKTLQSKKSAPAFEARRIIAGMMLADADRGLRGFNAAKIDDPNVLQKQIQKKQAMLVKQAASYESILEMNSPEYTVAALYRLGEMHEEFSTALFNAPAPTGSTQVEVDQLKTQLEKVAFPLKEDAHKFYEAAYKRSREVEVFTDWTKNVYEKMATVAPEEYHPVDEQSAEASYMAHKLTWGEVVARLAE